MIKNLFVLFVLGTFGRLYGQDFLETPRNEFFVANGQVNAVMRDGNHVYIGGEFDYVGPATGAATLADKQSAGVDFSFPRIDGEVYAAVSDGQGGWYLGGLFDKVRWMGQVYERSNIVHVRSDRSVDLDFAPVVNGTVRALARVGVFLIVGGDFSEVGGEFRNNLAALTLDNGTLQPWNPNPDGPVYALAAYGTNPNPTVFVGGDFSQIAGQNRRSLAQLQVNGLGQVTAFNTTPDDGMVYALLVREDPQGTPLLFVGGEFSQFGGQPRFNAAAVGLVGNNPVFPWAPDPNAPVYALNIGQSQEKVYMGGAFTQVQGQERRYAAAVAAAQGALLDAWNPNPNGVVHAIGRTDNPVEVLYLGGDFTRVGVGAGAQTRNRAAAFTPAGGLLPWNPNVGESVRVLIGDNTQQLFVGGLFSSIGGQARKNLARLHVQTGIPDPDWRPVVYGSVYALAKYQNFVVVGGSFDTITSASGSPTTFTTRKNLFAVSADLNGPVANWQPNPDGTVYSLLVADGQIFAGGAFANAGGQPRRRFAAFNGLNNQANATSVAFDGDVLALTKIGNTLYFGGRFTEADGQPRTYAASYSFDFNQLTNWNPVLNDEVYVLAPSSTGKIFVGGRFTQVSNLPIRYLTYLRTNVNDPAPVPGFDAQVDGPVYSLAFHSLENIYKLQIGGDFNELILYGEPTPRPVRNLACVVFDEINGVVELSFCDFMVVVDGPVRGIAAGEDGLFIGGNFERLVQTTFGFDNELIENAVFRRSLAAYNPCNLRVSVSNLTSKYVVCQGESVSLQAVASGQFGALNIQWSPNVSTPTDAVITVTPQSTTNYTVVVRDELGCYASEIVTITVLGNQDVSAGPDQVLCGSGGVTLQGSGGVTYSWSPTTGLDNPNSATPFASPAQTTQYTLTVTNAYGCVFTDVARVIVAPDPGEIIVSNVVNYCESTPSLQLSGQVDGAYEWTPPFGLSDPFARNPVVNIIDGNFANEYRVKVTTPSGCVKEDTVRLEFLPFGPQPFGGGQPITFCFGFDQEIVDQSGGQSYFWEPLQGVLEISNGVYILSPVSSVSYTVTVTYDNLCVGQAFFDVTVNQPPSFDLGPTRDICQGQQPVQLQATGGVSYLWAPAEGLSAVNIPNPIALPEQTTTYTVTVTDANGCINTDDVLIRVNPLPQPGLPTQTTICLGDTLTLAASTGAAYNWQPAQFVSDPSLPNPRLFPNQTTVFTVTTVSAAGCTTVVNTTVVVNTNAPNPVLSPNVTMCAGTSLQFNASGADYYVWNPPVEQLSNPNIANPVFTPQPNFDGTVTFTVTFGMVDGCELRRTVTVTVYPLPTTGVLDDTLYTCGLQPVTLSATGGVTFRWTPETGLSSTTEGTVQAAPEFTTVYTVYAIDGNGCEGPGATVVVVADSIPNSTATPNQTICLGQSVTLTAEGGVAYLWEPTIYFADPNSPEQTLTPNLTRNYTVKVFGPNGCFRSHTVQVAVNQNPAGNAGPDVSACGGVPTQLFASGGASYVWEPAATLNNPNAAAPIATPLETTVYTVVITAENGCTLVDSVLFTVFPRPDIDAGRDTFVCPGSTVPLSATGGIAYSWTPSAGLSNPNVRNPLAFPVTSTTYTVVATGQNGCVGVDSVRVSIITEEPPTITSVGPGAICSVGGSVQLRIPEQAGFTYQWYLNTNPIPGAMGAAYTATAAGQYFVEVFTTAGCSVRTLPYSVVSLPAPTANAGPDVAICTGASTTLNGSGAGPGGSYRWEPAGSLDNPFAQNPVASPAGTTVYTLTVITAQGCTDSDIVFVTVNQPPTALISAAGATEFCQGESVLLVAAGGPGYTYQWRRDGQNIPGEVNPSYLAENSGVYTCVVATPGCPSATSNAVTVRVNPGPVLQTGGNRSMCIGGTIALSVGPQTGTVRWEPAFGLQDPFAATTLASPTSTTIYTVTVVNENGCSATANVLVSVSLSPNLPLPDISIEGNRSPFVCEDGELPIFTQLRSNYSYQWYRNGVPLVGATGHRYVVRQPGNYSVEVAVSDGSCQPSRSYEVFIGLYYKPQFTIDYTQPSCDTCADGVIRILPTGAPSSYVYSIQNNEYFFSNVFEKVRAGEYMVRVRNVETGCVGETWLSLTVGRASRENDLSVGVYPNPGNGVYELTLSRPATGGYQIFDMTGKLVLAGRLVGESQRTLDVSDAPSGLYLLRLTVAGTVYEQKLVKQ